MNKIATYVITMESLTHDVLAFAKMVSQNLKGKQTYINSLLKQLNIDPTDSTKNFHDYYQLKEINELQDYSQALLDLDKERKRVLLKEERLKKIKLDTEVKQ